MNIEQDVSKEVMEVFKAISSDYYESKFEADEQFSEDTLTKCYENLKFNNKDIEINYEFIQYNLGRKWRGHLESIVPFLQLFLGIYDKNNPIDWKPISSRSLAYQKRLPEHISDPIHGMKSMLRLLRQLGVLALVENNYRFRSLYNTICYCYILDRELASNLLNFIKDEYPEMVKYSDREVRDSLIKDILQINDETELNLDELSEEQYNQLSKIRITSRTNINVNNIPSNKLQYYINASLENTYPYLKEINDLVKVINNRNQSQGQSIYSQIKYKPNYKLLPTGNITKVSLRASNSLANISSEKNGHTGSTREELLSQEWGINKKDLIEYDVSASVPKVTNLLNNGVWDDTNDLYSVIFNNSKPMSTEVRKTVKVLFMYLYFSGTKKNAIRNIRNVLDRVDKINIPHKDFERVLDAMYDSMVNTIGQPYGSEIFMHESNIYILVRDYLSREYPELKLAQVYDAFIFTDKSLLLELSGIIKSEAYNYYSNYYNQ